MTGQDTSFRGVAPLVLVLCALGLLAAAGGGAAKSRQTGAKPAAETTSPAERQYTTETVRGRVVWIEDALKRRFGVSTEPAAAETTVVLETALGRIVPIIPDTRGRSFAVDSRLRDTELELLVRRYADAPMIQVIRVFRPRQDGLYEVDYWCDICAIPMYIQKPCECCQGETRLRERPVKAGSDGG